MVCKTFDLVPAVNTNTSLAISWVEKMVISSLLLLRELLHVTGKVFLAWTNSWPARLVWYLLKYKPVGLVAENHVDQWSD